jgi:hypothetical protein
VCDTLLPLDDPQTSSPSSDLEYNKQQNSWLATLQREGMTMISEHRGLLSLCTFAVRSVHLSLAVALQR